MTAVIIFCTIIGITFFVMVLFYTNHFWKVMFPPRIAVLLMNASILHAFQQAHFALDAFSRALNQLNQIPTMKKPCITEYIPRIDRKGMEQVIGEMWSNADLLCCNDPDYDSVIAKCHATEATLRDRLRIQDEHTIDIRNFITFLVENKYHLDTNPHLKTSSRSDGFYEAFNQFKKCINDQA